MKLKATDEQMSQMAANATNASIPVGLGRTHFNPGEHFKASDFPIEGDSLYLDYVEGRMVKFGAKKLGKNLWETFDTVNPEYQSWCATYPSYEALAKSAGAEVAH